jgi:predicted dehydrogenase
MRAVRIAVLGAGLIGREHVQLLVAHRHAELAAVADVSSAAAAVAADHAVPLFTDYERMLDEIAPDGAIVALPNELHLAAGLACVERGIPALVEKPVAHTFAATTELAARAEEAGVPIMVGHHRRHSPDMREARRAIRDGELGEIVAVSGLCLIGKHDGYFDAEWRRREGGGPLLINAIHDVDCFRFLCGEIETVQALASSRARGFDVADTVAVTMRFESGALGTLLISDAVPSPWFWDIASGQALYFPVPERAADSYVIGGRTASLAVPSLDLWAHAPGGDWRDPISSRRLAIEASRCYVNQLDNLVAVIRGEAEPVVTARDATTTLAVTLAIGRSAAEERTVRVSEMFA